MNNIDFTIVIPTYNGGDRLPSLLEKLRLQTNIDHLKWEIIIIDNNSQDHTAELIKKYQQNWHYNYALKYYFESQQGLAYARSRGVKESQGKYIGFLDDDNHPDSNWIFSADNFLENHAECGAVGGKIYGNFATEPPANFNRIKSFLAITDHGENSHLFQPENLILPPGAGLVVRKNVWVENVPKKLNLIGRVGGQFLSGEDYECLLYIYKAGGEIWYNPEMISYHQIPGFRLEKKYLLSIAKGCGLPTCQLRMITAQNWQKPIIIIRTILGNIKRIIAHVFQYKNEIFTDVIVASELQFFLGCLFSVFYPFWKKVNNS